MARTITRPRKTSPTVSQSAKQTVPTNHKITSASRLAALDAMPSVVKGQKWRIPRGEAEVLHVGKSLVQYRFIKTGMVRGSLEMKSIANFAEALKTHKAELIP